MTKKIQILILALCALFLLSSCATRAKKLIVPICDEQVQIDERMAESKLIVLEDVPGTNEAPQFVANLACTYASRGKTVVIGLEIPKQEQRFVDAYFASEGTEADKRKLIVARFFSGWLRDGRNSEAVLTLIDSLRRYRKAGLEVEVLAFDSVEKGPQYREFANSDGNSMRPIGDDALFQTVDNAITRNPESVKILVSNASHLSKNTILSDPNLRSLAQMLSEKHQVLTFSPLYLAGTNSNACIAPRCQTRNWPIDRIAGPSAIRLYDDPGKYSDRGIDGAYFVGGGLTVSPAAVPALPYAEPNIQ